MGITDPSEVHFDKGLWGFDGTVWQKLPMVWGFTDTWQDSYYDPNAAAGNNTKAFGPVPAGEVWVMMSVIGVNYITNPTAVRFGVGTSPIGTLFYWQMAPGAGVPVVWTGALPIKAGQYLYVQIQGCVLNDDINNLVVGYKMGVS